MNWEKTPHSSPWWASYGSSFPSSLEERYRDIQSSQTQSFWRARSLLLLESRRRGKRPFLGFTVACSVGSELATFSMGLAGDMMTSLNGTIFRVTGHLCGEFPHKGQWRGALMFSLIWINDWVNNREAGDLRRHRSHYYVNVMDLSTRKLHCIGLGIGESTQTSLCEYRTSAELSAWIPMRVLDTSSTLSLASPRQTQETEESRGSRGWKGNNAKLKENIKTERNIDGLAHGCCVSSALSMA